MILHVALLSKVLHWKSNTCPSASSLKQHTAKFIEGLHGSGDPDFLGMALVLGGTGGEFAKAS